MHQWGEFSNSSVEFYADPPTTPEEHEAESDLYDPQREFHE